MNNLPSKEECHCGKNGHALNSINCPIHKYKIEPSKKEPESKCKKGFYDMDCYECKDMVECLDKPESKWKNLSSNEHLKDILEPESKEEWENELFKLFWKNPADILAIKEFIRSEKKKSFLNGLSKNQWRKDLKQ